MRDNPGLVTCSDWEVGRHPSREQRMERTIKSVLIEIGAIRPGLDIETAARMDEWASWLDASIGD